MMRAPRRRGNCAARLDRLFAAAGGYSADYRTPRSSPHAGTAPDLRALQHGFAAGLDRGAHLQLRVHLLLGVRGGRAAERLPQLRRRLRAAADPSGAARRWRGEARVGQRPASMQVTHKPVDAVAHAAFVALLQGLPPEQR